MEPERGFEPTNHPITSSRVGVPTEQRLSHYIRSCRPCKPVGGGQTSPRVPIRPISPASNRGSSDGLLPVSSGATPRNDAVDHRTGSGWRPRTTPSGISSPSWTGSWRRSHPPSPAGHRDRPAFHPAGASPQGQSAHRPLLRPQPGTRRSWVQLCERLQYDPSASLRAASPVQMVLGPQRHRPPFDARAFSHDKERLLRREVAWQFFDRVIEEARRRKLLPPDHFTVDGTLLEAWASIKSFRPKDEAGPGAVGKNPEVDFRGKPRRNDSHASTTDPEARLAR